MEYASLRKATNEFFNDVKKFIGLCIFQKSTTTQSTYFCIWRASELLSVRLNIVVRANHVTKCDAKVIPTAPCTDLAECFPPDGKVELATPTTERVRTVEIPAPNANLPQLIFKTVFE